MFLRLYVAAMADGHEFIALLGFPFLYHGIQERRLYGAVVCYGAVDMKLCPVSAD